MQSAIACECSYTYHPNDSIENIQIYTDKDFDEEKTANSEITGYFRIVKEKTISISDYLKQPAITFYWYPDISFFLKLVQPPMNDGEYEFTVVVSLSDGREIKNKTKVVFKT